QAPAEDVFHSRDNSLECRDVVFFDDVHREQTVVECLANAHNLEEEDQTDEACQKEQCRGNHFGMRALITQFVERADATCQDTGDSEVDAKHPPAVVERLICRRTGVVEFGKHYAFEPQPLVSIGRWIMLTSGRRLYGFRIDRGESHCGSSSGISR